MRCFHIQIWDNGGWNCRDDVDDDKIVEEVFDSILEEVKDEINLPLEALEQPLLLGGVKARASGDRNSLQFLIR